MGNYFGDDTTENCGICDHCVAQKKKHSIDYRSFQDLRKLLREEAGTAGLDIRNLIQSLPEAERENVMELIRHLMQEEEVMMNDLGRLFFRASPPA
jgi:superfamily II DNA helicase RecQ